MDAQRILYTTAVHTSSGSEVEMSLGVCLCMNTHTHTCNQSSILYLPVFVVVVLFDFP